MRQAILARPDTVGASALRSAEPPIERAGIKDTSPAVAIGEAHGGAEVVVVSSVGIDLDLVPFAADARRKLSPDARLVIAVPERDVHPVTVDLASGLERPADVVGLAAEWPEWTAPIPLP
jgi:hypothetical protein